MRAWFEPQRLHLGDQLFLDLLVLALLRGREQLVDQLVGDVLVLQAAQPLVFAGDLVEGFHHLRLELGLDRGERERILHLVVVEPVIADRRALLALGGSGAVCAVAAVLAEALRRRRAVAGGAERGRGGRRRRRRCHERGASENGAGCGRGRHRAGDARLAGNAGRVGVRHALHGIGARVGRLQVDDVAQEHLSFVQLIAPDDDRLEGERAFAQPRDHRLAAGLDALGDRDLALAREELDRAHLAQVHAHGIVGALARLGFLGLGNGLGRRVSTRSPPASSSSSSSSAPSSSPASSDSTTLMPISLSIASTSSIFSEVTSSEGSTPFNCSYVT